MDNEEKKFKIELKKSFDQISLPVNIPGHLKDILEEQKKANFAKFDAATEDVHQESECKKNGKRELEIFAKEKINEMNKKNEGISFSLVIIVCNVSACVVSIELLFGVHIIFISEICTFQWLRILFFKFVSVIHLLFCNNLFKKEMK